MPDTDEVVLIPSGRLGMSARTLMTKALTNMLQHPESVDMSTYIDGAPKWGAGRPFCGTVLCLAGHTCFAAGHSIEDLFEMTTRNRIPKVAAELLGLDLDARLRLFLVEHWPSQCVPWGRNIRPVDILQRVNFWLETGA